MKLINTKAATDILHVHKYTLWRWGEQGKVKMVWQNAGNMNYRLFDLSDVKRLAEKLPKKRAQGLQVYPGRKVSSK